MGGRSEAASSPLISPFLLFPLLCCLYLPAYLLSILFPLSVLPVCFTLFRLFPCESRASLPCCRSVFLCFSPIYQSLCSSCTEALLRHLSQYSLKQIKKEVWWGSGEGGGCLCEVVCVGWLFRRKDSFVFVIQGSRYYCQLDSITCFLLGKHILHFYLKLKPLGHLFASYSVLMLSFSASSSSYCPTFLAGCVLDLLESCHDNFCLQLRGSEAGQTFVCVCACVCVRACVCVCVCLTAQVVSVPLSASKTEYLLHEWKLTKLLQSRCLERCHSASP